MKTDVEFCFVDNDGKAYDEGGRYIGEDLYMIPERYCDKFIDTYKHIRGKNIAGVSKKDLISIIKKYYNNEALLYDSRFERFIQE